ncbi:hypothetical protein ACN469_37950 [Corallococcus terminator]
MSRAARASRLAAIVLALVLGAGCPGDPVPGDCIQGGTSTAPTLLAPLGQPVALLVSAATNMDCGRAGDAVPESVTVEVQDPNNLPVEATATVNSWTWMANVRFTPTMTGRYHLIVSFAPVGSLQQFDVYVAEDERQRPSVARVTNKAECLHLARTRGGTWVCDGRAFRESGEQEQPVGQARNPAVAVVGDVVWSLFEGQVRRYVDPGTGPLVLTGTAPFPLNASMDTTPHTRLATEDEYVLVDATTVYRYIFREGTGVLAVPTSEWAGLPGLTFSPDGTQVIALRADTTLWLVHRLQEPVTFVARTWACPFQLGAQDTYVPVPGKPCTPVTGEPLGYGEGVLWMRVMRSSGQGFSSVLLRYTVTAGHGLQEAGELPLDPGLSVSPPELRYGPTLPVVTSLTSSEFRATPRWDSERGELLLVLLPGAGVNPGVTRISDHFTWTVRHDVIPELRIYPWTSTP